MTAFEKTCLEKVTPKNNTKEPVTLSNLRWQCRRGMLELDILLNNFIDSFSDTSTTETSTAANAAEDKVKALTPQQYQSFELLLSYPDQTLIDLLLGNTMSADSKISAIVKLIRSTPINAEHSP